MTSMSPKQATMILAISDAIVDAVKVAGDLGAPGGVIYSALMGHGMSLGQFEGFMGALVKAGFIRKAGHLYFFIKDVRQAA